VRKFIDGRNIKSSIVMNDMLDDLWFGFDLDNRNAVSFAKSIKSCAFEGFFLNSDKLPTIRLFISCTALLVNVGENVAIRIIFLGPLKWSSDILYKRILPEPADASYMAKMVALTFEVIETGFTLCSKLAYILLLNFYTARFLSYIVLLVDDV
jgi:hypothetical protein